MKAIWKFSSPLTSGCSLSFKIQRLPLSILPIADFGIADFRLPIGDSCLLFAFAVSFGPPINE